VWLAGLKEAGNNRAWIITAMANAPGWDMIINAQGAFSYGGNIQESGLNFQPSSDNGQIFILLHELAHVVGAGIGASDEDPTVNARTTGRIWSHVAQKTSTGN